MTVQILLAIETWRSAIRDVAFDGTAVGFDMFTAQPSESRPERDLLRLDLRELTSSHKGLRACRTRQWFGALG